MSEQGQKSLGGLLVAAGLSSRMGEFKPLLTLGSAPLLAHALKKLRDAGVEKLVVVTGHRAEALQPILEEFGAEAVHNAAYAATQMFDSVKLGLAALQGVDRVLLSPADCPAIAPETYRAVLASPAAIARPVYEGKPGHPVMLAGRLIPRLLADEGPMGLRGALERCGEAIDDVPVADPGILMDADTPEELEALRRYWEKRA